MSNFGQCPTTISSSYCPCQQIYITHYQEFIIYITSNNTLSVIDISDNDIGPDGCQYLADRRNISLHKLIISKGKLGASGADKIGIMLYHNKSITSVDLGNNSIGDDGLEKLVEHLKSKAMNI